MSSAFIEHLSVSWRQCLRGQAMTGIGVMGLVILAAGWLFASFSLRQPLVVGVDISYSGMRALGAFLMLLWVQEAFVRDVERKTVLAVFAYPVRRSRYVLGRFAGIVMLALAAVMVWTTGLWIIGTYGSWGYEAGSVPVLGWALVLVAGGLWLDLVVIGAFMLFVVSFAQTRLLPLFMGICFALAARGLGPVIDYLRFVADADEKLKANFLPVLEMVRWLLPDLARLDWRAATLYGQWPEIGWLLQGAGGAAGYAIMMLTFAVVVYEHREFA